MFGWKNFRSELWRYCSAVFQLWELLLRSLMPFRFTQLCMWSFSFPVGGFALWAQCFLLCFKKFIIFFENFTDFSLCWVFVSAWAFSLASGRRGCSLTMGCRLLLAMVSLVVECGHQGALASGSPWPHVLPFSPSLTEFHFSPLSLCICCLLYLTCSFLRQPPGLPCTSFWSQFRCQFWKKHSLSSSLR